MHYPCTILTKDQDAYDNNPGLQNLLLDPYFKNIVTDINAPRVTFVATGVQNGVPTPGFSSSINYYDSYRAADLPANLIQAHAHHSGATRTKEKIKKAYSIHNAFNK